MATQKELELNLEILNSLKKDKVSLSSELKIMKKSLKDSVDEKNELTNVLATKSVQWGEVQNLVNTHVREKEELKKVLEAAKTESKNFKLQLKSAVEGALVTEATLKDLEDDLDTRREQSIILQEELLKQSVRLNGFNMLRCVVLCGIVWCCVVCCVVWCGVVCCVVLCCVVLCCVVLCCVVLCCVVWCGVVSSIPCSLFLSASSPPLLSSHLHYLAFCLIFLSPPLFAPPLSHITPLLFSHLILSYLTLPFSPSCESRISSRTKRRC